MKGKKKNNSHFYNIILIIISVILCITIIYSHLMVKRVNPSHDTVKDQPVEYDYKYYDVNGTSRAELLQAINEKGPEDMDGIRRAAYTGWYCTWDYQKTKNNNYCRADKMKVTTSITFFYPNWLDRSKASAEYAQKWDDFISKLKVHESWHEQNAISACTKIREEFAKIGSNQNCDDLDQAINDTGNNLMYEYWQKDKAYDVETNNGGSHGAIIPL